MQGQYHFQPKALIDLDLETFIPTQHVLRKIESTVDFDFINTLVAPYYC